MVEIEFLTYTEDVYDITVQDNHNFYANDILVHNCMEIALPTIPLKHEYDEEALISLCTLAATNWGEVSSPEELEEPCMISVMALDSLLDIQPYLLPAAANSTKWYRSLGVGINNLAYFLAKRGLSYDTNKETLSEVHKYSEAQQYFLTKTSIELAKRYGAFSKINDTVYADGKFTWENYKHTVDELVEHALLFDWESLREDLVKYGIRNSTLSAAMPSECQSKDNKMLLADGSIKTLGEILVDSGLDVESIEKANLVGQRFDIAPIYLPQGDAYQAYYNGVQPVYEIEFEDGNTYKFTGNHLLKVKTKIGEIWKQVADLTEEDQVVTL